MHREFLNKLHNLLGSNKMIKYYSMRRPDKGGGKSLINNQNWFIFLSDKTIKLFIYFIHWPLLKFFT